MNPTEVNESAIVVDNLSVRYKLKNDSILAVENISFCIRANEFVSVLGPSGCGKSTLLNTIGGFLKPTSGTVSLNGTKVSGPRTDLGMVFQKHSLFPWKTIRENIGFGMRMRGVSKSKIDTAVEQYANEVGLSDFLMRYPSQLSGGMQQRAALVRAFANDPKVLLMDEPFASVDAQTSYHMQVLLNKVWVNNPKTVIFVTHNVDEALFLSDRILFLTKRPSRIAEEILVDIPRPRDYVVFKDPKFVSMRDSLLRKIFAIDK